MDDHGTGLTPKTCNLRLTAIRSFLEYAAQEYLWIMPVYTDACSVAGVKTTSRAIEYFEPPEMTALLAAPSGSSKTDRRNQMMLIFLYDTAARVAEARQVKVSDLHLDAEVPYVTLLGKGRKYRNIPLMEKTIHHLKRYLKDFHGSDSKTDRPLFYSKAHGLVHELSSDTFEKMIKRYAAKCRADGYPMPDHVHCQYDKKNPCDGLISRRRTAASYPAAAWPRKHFYNQRLLCVCHAGCSCKSISSR